MTSFYKTLEDKIKDPPERICQELVVSNPYQTLLGMIRWGKRLKTEDIKNELVYSLLNLKVEDHIAINLEGKMGGPYINNIIKLNGKALHSKHIFAHFFNEDVSKKLINGTINGALFDRYVRGIGKTLVEKVFGVDTYSVFRYAYSKHLQTKDMRAGANTYFTHPVRVAHKLRKQGLDRSYILVALLHDVVEEMQKLRYKKIDKINKNIRKNPKRYKEYEVATDLINRQIKDPPEFKEISNLARKGEDISDRVTNQVRAVSNNLGPGKYEEYITNMFILSSTYFSKKETDICTLYDIPTIVKLADAIDNTETLKGTSVDQTLKRLRRNSILGERTCRFLNAKKIYEENNNKIWGNLKELVEVSLDFSIEFYDLYLRESKKHSKTEKKEEQFDLSYQHIANQFSQIHDKLVLLAKEVSPNKNYIKSRNLQSKIRLKNIGQIFGYNG